MKAQKGQIKSEIVKENENGHIFLSATPYDDYQDTIEYAVNKQNGESLGRFETFNEANKVFNSELA